MLFRTRADKVILSFLLLAGISSCIAEEDGYSYEKPAIAFNTGYNNVGAASQGSSQSIYQQQPQYVGAPSTVKPAAAIGGYPQQRIPPEAIGSLVGSRQTVSSGFGQQSGQISGFGQTARPQQVGYQGVGQQSGFGQAARPQQVVSITSRPQTVSSGFQGFGQQSGFGQAARPQQVVSVTSKPQSVSSGYQAFGQQTARPQQVVSVTSRPQTVSSGFQGFGQQSGFGQAARPQQVVSITSRPQTVSSGFQGFGQQSGFGQAARPQQVVSVTSKPQSVSSGYQAFGQQTARPQQVVSVTSRPQTVSSGFQGFGQQSGFGQSSRPQQVVSVTSRPQSVSSGYQAFGQQTARPQPAVSIISKPVSSGFQNFGQQSAGQLSGLGQTGQYQPVSSTARPQTSFGLGQSTVQLSGQKLAGSSSFGGSQTFGQSVVKPSVSLSGPIVFSTVRPQTSFGLSQSNLVSGSRPTSQISTGVSQTGQYQGGQYNQQASDVRPTVSSSPRPQTSFSGVSGQYQGGQYNQQLPGARPSVSSTVRPQTSFGGYQAGQLSAIKPSTGSIAFGQSSSGVSQSGQYQGGLQAVKPSTGFPSSVSSASGQYQRPSVVSTPRPQSNFGASQGFAQTTYQKPQAIQSTYSQTVQKPQVLVQTASTTARPTVVPQLSYLPPLSQTLSVTAKPQPAFQGFTGSPSTSRPAIAIVKPQTSFGAFQGFGQSTLQKPAVTTTTFSQYGQQGVKPSVITGQYQRPVVSTTVRPQVSVGTVKPQTSFGGYQGSNQLTGGTFQTGILQGNQVAKPASFGLNSQTTQYQVKPQVGQYQGNLQLTGQYQKPVVPSVSVFKPQTTLGGSQSFGQTTYQRPQVSQPTITYGQTVQRPQVQVPKVPALNLVQTVSSTARPQVGQYQGNVQLSTARPSTAFSAGLVQTGQYQTPVISVSKPQSAFGVSQSFSQGNQVGKPFGLSSQTNQYQVKPQVGQYQGNLQLTGQYQKPVVPSVSVLKPQTNLGGSQSFGQTTYQRPQVSQTTTTYGQTVQRPQVQVPKVPALNLVQTVSSTARPQVGQYQGNLQLSTARPSTAFSAGLVQTGQYQTPVISVSKPQSTFGVSQSFSQGNQVGKPFGLSSQTNQYQVKPQVGQYQGNLQLTGQYQKPVVPSVTVLKPQTTLGGSQSFGQSTYQRPQVSQPTTTYGQTVQRPQVQVPNVQAVNFGQGASTTSRPTVIQAPQTQVTYLPPQPQIAKLTVTAKPQPVFQGFTGSTTTSRPVVAAVQQSVVQKPVVTTTTFSQYGQQPTVITGQYQSPIVSTTARPQVSTIAPQYQQPIRLPTPAVKSPAIFARVDSAIAQPLAPSQNLEYLPPIGAKLPSNVARSSGAVQSQSFFDLASATANQVVDVAQEQKLSGSVKTNQVSSGAQEQKVDGINIRGNFDTATKQGQVQDSTNVYQSLGGSASAVGASTPQVSASQQNQDNTQTATLQTSFRAGNQAPVGSLNYQRNQLSSQQFAETQPQASPSHQVVQTQLHVLDRDQAASDDIQDQYEAASQNIGYFQYRTVDDTPIAESQIYGQYYQPTTNVDNSQYSAPSSDLGSRFQVVDSQIEEDSPVQDPQPLNPEEHQVRQLEEKADSDKEEFAVKSLQPGSYVGPHVNKDSDKEYNVFDYDQYSADPADTETY